MFIEIASINALKTHTEGLTHKASVVEYARELYSVRPSNEMGFRLTNPRIPMKDVGKFSGVGPYGLGARTGQYM